MEFLQLLFLSLLFLAGLLTLFSKRLLPWQTPVTPPRSSAASNGRSSSVAAGKGEEEIKRVFRSFDKNSDGFINRQELGESLKKIGISTGEDEVAQILHRFDTNGDGLIDFDEFSGILPNLSPNLSREGVDACAGDDVEVDLKEAFDVFDGNGDGLISVAELSLVLSNLGMNEGKRAEACEEMIRKVDTDGDGMVSFDEFKNMMKASNGSRLIPTF